MDNLFSIFVKLGLKNPFGKNNVHCLASKTGFYTEKQKPLLLQT